MKLLRRTLSLLLLLAAPSFALAQTAACPKPPAVLAPGQTNIFSPQQEEWLGEALTDYNERSDTFMKDRALNDYANGIMQKLLAVLPPSKLHFTIKVLDSQQINAYSIAGGHVYLNRKLITTSKNEDEVAAIIGHEIGHILAHQTAIELSADFKRLLHVTSVGDKADVYDKVHKWLDAKKKDTHQQNDMEERQSGADQVGVYAIAAAGYRPQAFAEFWNRSFFVEGRTGNVFTDILGATTERSRRLRGMLQMVKALPPGCGSSETQAPAEYVAWREKVLLNNPGVEAGATSAAHELALTPPLRSELKRLRFSPNGKYVLAQDESSVSVLTREPFRFLFRFDADEALPASFSPDSERVVFHTAGLHSEEWNIAKQERVATREPLVRDACFQSFLSPDGRTIACLNIREADFRARLQLLDSTSGAIVFEKNDLFTPFRRLYLMLDRGDDLQGLVPSAISPDGNTLLVGVGETMVAIDLNTRTLRPLPESFRTSLAGPYTFQGLDKIVSVNLNNRKDSGTFHFPDGKRISKSAFPFSELEGITSGEYILTRGMNEYAVALFDPAKSEYLIASKNRAMDSWSGNIVLEAPDGRVQLIRMSDPDHDSLVAMPIGPLSTLRTVALSHNQRYLALSNKRRSSIWDLQTGKSVSTMRGFSAVSFDQSDNLLIDFPKQETQERTIARVRVAPSAVLSTTAKVGERARFVSGRLFEWKGDPKNASAALEHEDATRPKDDGKHEVTVRDALDNKVLWSREFKDMPVHNDNEIEGQTILAFDMRGEEAQARLSAKSSLNEQAARVKTRYDGVLVQVLDDQTGAILHEVVIERPETLRNMLRLRYAANMFSTLTRDGRTVFYDGDTGNRLRTVFGILLAANEETRRVLIGNREDEAIVFDAAGTELTHLRLGHNIRFAFFGNHGTQLTVLTSDHMLRTVDIPSAK